MFRLRRNYCVTVMDNWTRTRLFWTRKRARRWRARHPGSHLWDWRGYWHEIEKPPPPWPKKGIQIDGRPGDQPGDAITIADLERGFGVRRDG